MVHALQGSLAHDFVDIEDDGSGGAEDCISVRILQREQQVSGSNVVVVQSLVLAVLGVHESKMSRATCEECVQEHGLVEGMEGQEAREVFVGVHTVHPYADLLDKDLHVEHLFLSFEVVARRSGRGTCRWVHGIRLGRRRRCWMVLALLLLLLVVLIERVLHGREVRLVVGCLGRLHQRGHVVVGIAQALVVLVVVVIVHGIGIHVAAANILGGNGARLVLEGDAVVIALGNEVGGALAGRVEEVELLAPAALALRFGAVVARRLALVALEMALSARQAAGARALGLGLGGAVVVSLARRGGARPGSSTRRRVAGRGCDGGHAVDIGCSEGHVGAGAHWMRREERRSEAMAMRDASPGRQTVSGRPSAAVLGYAADMSSILASLPHR